MVSRRRYLASAVGAGALAIAGCLGSDDEPEQDPGSGENGTTGWSSIDVDELLAWFPADTVRPWFRSYERMVADGDLEADEKPDHGGATAFAEVEFTERSGTNRRIHFLEDEPESVGENQTVYDADDYVALIGSGLEADHFVDAYEGAADGVTDQNDDVRPGYEAVELDQEVLGYFEYHAQPYSVAVSSTDGDAGELAAVFESEPTDSEIETVREEEEGVGDVLRTDGRVVVFDFTMPEP